MSETDPSMYLRKQDNLQLIEHTKMFDSKKWLWIPDEEEAFKSACVKKQKGDKVVLELVDGSVRNISMQNIFYRINNCVIYRRLRWTLATRNK